MSWVPRLWAQSRVKVTSSMVVGIGDNLFLLYQYDIECSDSNVGTMLTASDAEGCWDKATMVSVYIVGTRVASVLALSFITSMAFETVTWRGSGMWLWLLFSLTTESSSANHIDGFWDCDLERIRDVIVIVVFTYNWIILRQGCSSWAAPFDTPPVLVTIIAPLVGCIMEPTQIQVSGSPLSLGEFWWY